jgi:hypothetical protein
VIQDNNCLYIIHTFGLGDSVMLLNALDRLSKYDRDHLCVLTNESSVHEYLLQKNIRVQFKSLAKIIIYITYKKLSRKKITVMRSFGGTRFKNLCLSFYFNVFLIPYIWEVTDRVELTPWSIRSSKNAYLLSKFFQLTEQDFRYKTFPMFLGLRDRKFKLPGVLNVKILIHFGEGDSLSKSLPLEVQGKIIAFYEAADWVNSIFVLKGPRESHSEVNSSLKVQYIGGSKPLRLGDLLELAKEVDLCACNDTGIGHLMSYEGVKVDLWINGNSLSLLHQVLPNHVNSLTII